MDSSTSAKHLLQGHRCHNCVFSHYILGNIPDECALFTTDVTDKQVFIGDFCNFYTSDNILEGKSILDSVKLQNNMVKVISG